MVLALGVIIEETHQASAVHRTAHSRDSFCKDNPKNIHHPNNRVEFCNRIKQADPWCYILLFTTDIVLVLCCFGMLLLLADWILFVAPVRVNRGTSDLTRARRTSTTMRFLFPKFSPTNLCSSLLWTICCFHDILCQKTGMIKFAIDDFNGKISQSYS